MFQEAQYLPLACRDGAAAPRRREGWLSLGILRDSQGEGGGAFRDGSGYCKGGEGLEAGGEQRGSLGAGSQAPGPEPAPQAWALPYGESSQPGT